MPTTGTTTIIDVRPPGEATVGLPTTPHASRAVSTDGCDWPARLQLLGRFALTVHGRPEPLGTGCRRLLAVLALRTGHAGRREVAELLWPDATGGRAAANLRSVLWRLHKTGLDIIDTTVSDLHLRAGIHVDWYHVMHLARQLINRSVMMDADELGRAMTANFHDDLLPELADEDWLNHEAECFRQLRLHALESLSERLTRAGWIGAAIDVALRAVRVDPYRESAHQTLIQAYLAEGNQLAARRQYHAYRTILHQELGLQPSTRLSRLLTAD